jgi:hypothetical protein
MSGPSSGNTPQEMFEYLIERPVPSAVTDLQGVGDTWQGYQIWLRFRATEEYAAILGTKGYREVPCNDVESNFILPENYDRFSPMWEPVMDTCFEGEILNTWGNGYHVFGFNVVTRDIHFYGTAP